MILSARFLDHVASVNLFDTALLAEFTEGDTLDVYFQLIDLSKDTAGEGFRPAGRRYCPVAGSSVSATVDNIDDGKKVTRACTQPFAVDTSIWRLSILASDPIKAGTHNLILTLVEGGVTRKCLVKAAVRVHPNTNV